MDQKGLVAQHKDCGLGEQGETGGCAAFVIQRLQNSFKLKSCNMVALGCHFCQPMQHYKGERGGGRLLSS